MRKPVNSESKISQLVKPKPTIGFGYKSSADVQIKADSSYMNVRLSSRILIAQSIDKQLNDTLFKKFVPKTKEELEGYVHRRREVLSTPDAVNKLRQESIRKKRELGR